MTETVLTHTKKNMIVYDGFNEKIPRKIVSTFMTETSIEKKKLIINDVCFALSTVVSVSEFYPIHYVNKY